MFYPFWLTTPSSKHPPKLTAPGIVGTFKTLFNKNIRSTEHHEIITRLHEISHSTDELANSVLAVMVISVNLSLIMANTFDLLLGTDLDASLKDLAKSSDSPAFSGYVLESLREYLSTLI